jgi:hypothetical protein
MFVVVLVKSSLFGPLYVGYSSMFDGIWCSPSTAAFRTMPSAPTSGFCSSVSIRFRIRRSSIPLQAPHIGGRATAKVVSAFSIIDEPQALSDACDAAHDVVESDLLLQHVVLHITYDLEAAPTSELDQAKYRVVWAPPAPYMRNQEHLIDTIMRD